MESRVAAERPQSAINILHVPDVSDANPEPISDADKTFGEFISPQKLREVSGAKSLDRITELKIKVDSAETSIGNIGLMAPNIKSLNLSNSFIASVRDLGTNLNFLNTLWLSRCCLKELDGISCLASLKELYLAYNEIFDISPLSMLEQLQVLDLEGNNIDDITQVEFLSLCANLDMLTLKGNPVEFSPSPTTNQKDLKFYSYRDAILRCLPQLNVLDDTAFVLRCQSDGKMVKQDVDDESGNMDPTFKEDMKVIQESLKTLEITIAKNETTEHENEFTRPATARKREGSSKRSSASSTRDLTSPSSIANSVSPDIPENEEYTSSSLTLGRVMCGNPVAALRSRSRVKNIQQHQQRQHRTKLYEPERSYETDSIADFPIDDVLDELKNWRKKNSKLFDNHSNCTIVEIEDASRPQYLHTPTPPNSSKPRQRTSLFRRSLPLGLKGLGDDVDSSRPHTSGDVRQQMQNFPSANFLINRDSGVSSECSVSSQNEVKDDFKRLHGTDNSTVDISFRPNTARAAVKLSPIVRNHERFTNKMGGS